MYLIDEDNSQKESLIRGPQSLYDYFKRRDVYKVL